MGFFMPRTEANQGRRQGEVGARQTNEIEVKQEPRPRLEWMSGLAKKLTEALNTGRVP